MNLITQLFLTILTLSFLSACGPSDRAISLAEIDGVAADGKALYDANCASCHGMTARGGSGPNLVKELAEHDDADMIEVILTGDGSMPPYDSLEDQEIADIMAYIKSL